MSSEVFVFGSNKAGRHGKGAAFIAKMYHGAIQGQGEGRMGSSYGIPTKDEELKVLPLTTIKKSVDNFLSYARAHPDLIFKVTPIGTGLAGYSHDDIAPMFSFAPPNCIMPRKWLEHLAYNEELKYWNC